jgi:hypothetical protein
MKNLEEYFIIEVAECKVTDPKVKEDVIKQRRETHTDTIINRNDQNKN